MGDSGEGGDTDTDADSDTDTDADSDTDTDTESDTDTDTDTDTDADTAGSWEYGETGPCAPTSAWADGPVPAALLTSIPYDSSYDAGMAASRALIGVGSGGSYGEAHIISGATVVAIADEPRWNYLRRYYVADANDTIVVESQDPAAIGDKVTFAWNDYETYGDLPMMEDPGSWTVGTSDNPVYARHLGAATVDFDQYSQLIHEAGELTGVSSLDCGTGYTCFVFEHDGVRDRIRLATLNDFGLDVDYTGGLCAEVIAPAAERYVSGTVTGYYLDVADSRWMHVWAVP